jgi:hypothetical protein
MLTPRDIMYGLLAVGAAMTMLVAFHVISADSIVVEDLDKVIQVETGINLQPIEEALGKP